MIVTKPTSNPVGRKETPVEKLHKKQTSIPFPMLRMLPIDNKEKCEKEKREIPRRHEPVVQ